MRRKKMKFLPNPKSKFHGLDIPGLVKTNIQYESNSLGYRGEDFNESAKIHIFVAGDSHVGGSGIERWEDTHSYVFKEIYADKKSIPLEDINLMNFAVGGCSNDYIVRTLMANCLVKKPDILICHFAYKKNKEILGDTIEKYCPSWHGANSDLLNHPLMGETNLFVDMLKNVLLLQYFCQRHQIKYIFSWSENNSLVSFKRNFGETHRGLLKEINFSFFLDKHVRDIQEDVALDYVPNVSNGHVGVKTHKLYAQLIYDKYVELYG